MPLAQQDLQQIGEYVKNHISEWIAEQSLGKPPEVYELELRERMVRVEEALKHQHELMRQGFEQVDRRLELMAADMDKRFEQVDMRFNEMLARHDKHFFWLLGFITTGVGLVIAAIRYL